MNNYFIGAWIAPPPQAVDQANNPDFMTKEQYKYIKESGIDIIYGLYENAESDISLIHKALDLSSWAGIGYLVRDSRIIKATSEAELLRYLEPYINHEACRGVLVIDEPGLIHFEKLKVLQEIFYRHYSNKIFYTNLLPLHANDNQFYNGAFGGPLDGGKIGYQTYYEKYLQEVKPKFLSYDLYPFEQAYPFIRTDYFKQHSLIKNLCVKENIPYYNFIQTCSFNHHVRIPTQQEIRFQVFTSLAYGTTGFQYFTYFIPLENTHEIFKGSMIDAQGNKNDQYYYVQHVNKKLKKLLDILKDYRYMGIDYDESQNQYESVDKTPVLSSKYALDKDLLIGVYENDSAYTLLVVNTNLTLESKSFELDLVHLPNVEVLRENGFIKEKRHIKLNILSGDAALIKINKE